MNTLTTVSEVTMRAIQPLPGMVQIEHRPHRRALDTGALRPALPGHPKRDEQQPEDEEPWQ